MNFSVLITSKAKLQLVACACWWSEHRDADQAVRWLDGFEEAIASLSENPELHCFARENGLYELPYPVRQLLYGIGTRPTHRAVFEVRGNAVYVVAVRHLAQCDLSSEEL